MKNLLLVLLTLATVVLGYFTYQLAHRVAVTERAALYLFAPTEVHDAAGKSLRRVDLFDLVLTSALKADGKHPHVQESPR